MMRQAGRWLLAAIVMAAITVLPEPSPVEAQTCSLAPTAGTVTRTLQTPEGTRRYRLRVPQGLTGPEAMLVVSLHPYNFLGLVDILQGQEDTSGLSRAADAQKFIIAYPEGWPGRPSMPFWEGWDVVKAANNPDVAFILAVIDDISDDYCVDAEHIHTEGFSAGAAMSQRMACAAPAVIASSVSHATNGLESPLPDGTTPEPCTPSLPVSVFLSCTAEDSFGATDCVPSRDAWRARLACPGTGSLLGGIPYGLVETTGPCQGGTEIWRRVWDGVAHAYPTGPALARYHAETVLFFRSHPLN